MPSLSSLNVSLTDELEKFVRDRVATGRYATSSEVIREGLRLLQEKEREAEEALGVLKGKLKRACEQADRGELVDGDEVFAKVDELLKRRRRERIKRAS